MNPSKVK